MNWPLKIDFPPDTTLTGTLFGERLAVVHRDGALALEHGDEHLVVGLPARTKSLLAGPALGALPYLILPDPPLVIPRQTELTVALRVPLHLDLAARGVGDAQARLRTIPPVGLTRALYGPVDAGVLCWSVRGKSQVLPEIRLAGHAAELAATVRVTCESRGAPTVRVSRIMIPTDMIGLYETADGLQLSDVTMTILGESDAELTMEPPPRSKPISDVLGAPLEPARRAFAFSHTYRNRTGLEYGF